MTKNIPVIELPKDSLIWSVNKDKGYKKPQRDLLNPTKWPMEHKPFIYFHFLLTGKQTKQIKKWVAQNKGMPNDSKNPLMVTPFEPKQLLYVGERYQTRRTSVRYKHYDWLPKFVNRSIFTHRYVINDQRFAWQEPLNKQGMPRKTVEALVYLDLLVLLWCYQGALQGCRGMQFNRHLMLKPHVIDMHAKVMASLTPYLPAVNSARLHLAEIKRMVHRSAPS